MVTTPRAGLHQPYTMYSISYIYQKPFQEDSKSLSEAIQQLERVKAVQLAIEVKQLIIDAVIEEGRQIQESGPQPVRPKSQNVVCTKSVIDYQTNWKIFISSAVEDNTIKVMNLAFNNNCTHFT